jgi:hypothetical protein
VSPTIARIGRLWQSTRVTFAERRAARALALVIALAPVVVVVLAVQPRAGQTVASATSAAAPGWEPDPFSVGSITFTDASGVVVTTGNMSSPLAAFAVGSKLVDTGDKDGSLQVYLPAKGQNPALWTGEPVSLDTVFNPAPAAWPANLKGLVADGLPVIKEGSTDTTPAQFAGDLPNTDATGPNSSSAANDSTWQNLYEIRMLTGTNTSQYDSADILLNPTAGTWQVVYPPASTSLPSSSASPSPSPSPSHSPSPSPSPSPTASPSPSPSPTASPSPSASPSSGVIVATGTSGTLGANPSLAAGDNVTLQVAGFTAGESVGVTLHSTPQTLPPVTASSSGTVGYQFTVGSDLPAGTHTLVFVGATSTKTQTWAFTVAAAQVNDPDPAAPSSGSLPFTGTNSGRTLIVGIAALWSGLVLMLVSRPRRTLVVAGGGRHRSQPLQIFQAQSRPILQPGRHRGGRHRR